MSDTVRLTFPASHVALVTLDRPEAANAVDAALAIALERAVIAVEADPAVRVAVLTGAGSRAFCAGADLKIIAAGARETLYTPAGGFAGFVDARRDKPWIVAVEGPALAGGLEIALACDFIIASDRARFALPEVKRGLIAAAGGLFRLPRRVTRGLAFEMIATGDAIDAADAARHGLVDRVVPAGTAIDAALALAARIAAAAPVAVRESLKIMRAALDPPIETDHLRRLSAEGSARNATTADFLEGPRAFLEKRKPNWSS